ncbi:MAG: DUF618 domain-containing [Lasallia pustulata]|uniref:DUF618 domain-containing n=1 Tax=Lasallia pustulata TaxID=136370 RepID=A0A5M8PSW6_9LECA|nr:MAG: DUF618 domain-containing [Lasallia pustulata]
MAYTDDAVKAKLSALNETQESIVTVAQWVMFHRRHADRTGQLWLQKLKDSGANKRLNLIYLANEVAQQSKARRKDDFLIAFSPIIAEASATAYKGATTEVQQKIRRVIEVWRQRQIFEQPIQEAVEARIDELDKSRSSGKKPLLGGSLFSNPSGPSAPLELQPIFPFHIAVSKAVVAATGAASAANLEYDKLTDPNTSTPTPPVHAARLSSLLRSLASAEGAVSESIKARRALVEGLEKLLQTNKTALASEESQHFELVSRKTTIEAKKREVEDGIMRGLSAEPSPPIHGSPGLESTPNGKGLRHDSASAEPERPDVEALTPPPMETLTPVGSPRAEGLSILTITTGADLIHEQPPNHNEAAPATSPPLIPATAGSDLLSSFAMPPVRHHPGSPFSNNNSGGAFKKRKLEADYGDFGSGDAMEDLDEDVAELLRAESGGH